MRRQHSCDQCRKSKRACDAPPMRDLVEPDARHRPCSYCIRTNKTCTMEWARSQSAAHSVSSASSSSLPSKRQRTAVESSWPLVDDFDASSSNLLDASQIPPLVFPDVAIPTLDFASALPAEPSASLHLGLEDLLRDDSVESESPLLSDCLAAVMNPSDTLDLDALLPPSVTHPSHSPSSATQSHPTQSSHPSHPSLPRPKRRRRSSGWTDSSLSVSPFAVDQTMMARSNNQLISTSLLQIYHDVFEHNLSCWLTEFTCPYKTPRWSTDAVHVQREWGPAWSNRIYRRTIKLDRVAQSTSMMQLARSDDKAAQKALHLAIMAFATQWAQGSRRQRQRYGQFDLAEDLAAEMSDEFDRNLQRHFWDQAQRALQDVADLESYRVVCAELIFGLTQKPWSNEDHPSVVDPAMFSRRGGSRIKTSAMAQINAIISKEGPPTYMERAARKMHALKFKYDSSRRGMGGLAESAALSGEDKSTIGLLYWLAVMFDTVSSSMNERPVVVSDQDCQHTQETEDTSRWRVNMFIQDLDRPSQPLHWPCPYEVAAEAVTKSAPVKVLLFRHVSYLQNILRKGGRGQGVEDIIRSTTAVYRYWNMTYGSFFRELVQRFDSVPARIQGWFVCISAHWHLAALMLADLVDFIDQHALGLDADIQSRAGSRMASRIREASVRELSDLASVATPPDEANTPPQLPDFHHAVGEGTILTEPWTMILIRAFSKAAVILLGEADESLGALGHCDLTDGLDRAEECIKALWLLGKKSDMARKIAEILSVASDGLH